jgi:hypothetical protein
MLRWRSISGMPACPVVVIMTSSSSRIKPERQRHEAVPGLRSLTRDGTPYQRRADVEAEIAEALGHSQAEWPGMCHGPKRLSNEAIVFLVRRSANQDRDACGQLIRYLGRSVAGIAKHWAQGFDSLTTDEIVWQVEIEIVELLLTVTPTRQSEFLEIAFGKAVERRTINAVKKRRHSPMPLCATAGDDSDDRTESEGLEESVADEGPLPEEIAAQLQDKVRRRERLGKARASVKDPRHLEAVILRHIYGWPFTEKDDSKPSLVKHFRKSERQIRNWIHDGLEAMREAIGEER